jgi:hypothetical protein
MIPEGSGEVNKFDRKSASYLTQSRSPPYKGTVISERACHETFRLASESGLANLINPCAPRREAQV